MKNICFVLCIIFMMSAKQAFSSEAGMPQLNPEFWISQIFWLVAIFSILYLIISKIFLPKITYSIENRKSRIINDLDEAQKLKEKAEGKLNEYNLIIENSKKEAKKITEDNKKKLDKDIEEKKKIFDGEIEKELEATEKEIKNLKKNSLPSITEIAAKTSTEIMREVINIEVNESNVLAIVNDIVKKEMEKNL